MTDMQLERISPGVVYLKIDGKLDVAMLAEAQQQTLDQMHALGEDRWAVILDIRDGNIPMFDLNLTALRRLLRIDQEYVAGYVVIAASAASRMMLNTYKQVLNVPIIHVMDYAPATEEARRLLVQDRTA